jgi:hypothetical protein
MIKLVWTAAALTINGPVAGEIPETPTFKDRATCVAFGERMTPRLQDYVRGLLKADWDLEVRVVFRCEPAGNPA